MQSGGWLLLFAVIAAAASGVPGLFCDRRSSLGGALAIALMSASALGGFAGAMQCLGSPTTVLISAALPIPNASFSLSADSLSVFFLLPIFVVSALGSWYGQAYWRAAEHPDNARKLRLFYGWLAACLMIVVLAGNSVTFLFGWEGMALAAFFLVGTEDDREDVREAAWLYLAASHAATLSLFTLFAVLYGLTGTFELRPFTAAEVSPGWSATLFLLALGGFGLKSGLMPLHFWLPSAHAMAPSHVSAMMSGVLIKMGIYGLVRMTGLLPDPPLWWGGLLLTLGALSAVFGMVFALSQQDLKRLMAYSSVENIGVIAIGLGLALLGRALHHPAWCVLGLSGALLHVWNHSVFKSLLFFAAGAVIHTTGTRQIDQLGGLARKMPWTAAAFLMGATAACALPPGNGFVSEFLLYLGLFQTLGRPGEPALSGVVFAIPALAMVGAAAVACFVKAYGIVFLGVPRRPIPDSPHDPEWAIRGPLVALAAGALLLGFVPVIITPWLDAICVRWFGTAGDVVPSLATLAPLTALLWTMAALVAMLLGGYFILQAMIRDRPYAEAETWGCGYLAPTPRLQYTGSSLTQFLMQLFDWSLRPEELRPEIRELFPTQAHYWVHVPEFVLDRGVRPLFNTLAQRALWFRLLQQGHVQIYLLYILGMLVVLFTAF
jgi:hydrogenase-4 component B